MLSIEEVQPGATSPDDVRERVEHLLQAAVEIGQTTFHAHEEPSLLNDVIQRLTWALAMQYGTVLLHDGQQLEAKALTGAEEAVHPLPPLCDWMTARLQEDRTQAIRVWSDDALISLPAFPASCGLRTLALVPLPTHGAMLGAIALGDPQARSLLPAEIDTLRLIGQLLAQGLRGMRLQAKLDTLSRRPVTAEAQESRIMTADPLTGVANRQYFMEELQRAVADAADIGGQLSLLIIDTDHFSAINEGYGWQVGDQVLRRVAESIQWSIRGRDVAARYGNDEFCVLLPATGGIGAVVVAERLRELIAAILFTEGDFTWNVTVSIGVASLASHVTTAEQLLSKTTRCLLEAKAMGGNQIIFDWDEALEENGDA